MGCKYFSSAGILLSILLMALPCSVTMDGLQCSHLSVSLIGSGNLFPLMAVSFALLAIVFLWIRRDYGQMSPICLGLSLVSQILSWILFHTFGLVGGASALLHLAVLLQRYLPNHQANP